jgi:hypothetical protein
MRRIDLVEATLEGWSRASPAQREKFLKAGVKAALRLGGPEFRRWLRRRVRQPPLAAPIDLAAFAISEGDLALVLKTLEQRHHRGAPVAT